MFIENILPSRLSNFFFFDGEKIAEVAVEDTDTKMKESIRSLLGISVLDVLSNDMSRIISRSTKKNTDDKSVLELQKLRSYKDEMAKKMSDLDARIKEKKLKLDEKIKHLDLMKNEYKAKGGDVVKQREDLYQKKISLVASLNQCNELLINDAASQLPLVLVRNLLLDIEEQAILEQDKKTLAMTLYQMKYMLKSYKKEFPDNAEKASHFINYIDENAESGDIEEIYGLSDNVLLRDYNLY